MSSEEVNSTNSFVDIIANTTGMIIKLTLLAMLLGHQQSRKVNSQAQHYDDARKHLKQQKAEQAGLPDLLMESENELSRLSDRMKKINEEVSQADATLIQLNSQIEKLNTAIKQAKAEGDITPGALAARQRAAEEKYEALIAATPTEQRKLVNGQDVASLDDQVKKATAHVEELKQKVAAFQERIRQEEVHLAEEEAKATTARAILMKQKERLFHEIVIHRPASMRPSGSTPILGECYRDSQGIDRIRLLTRDKNYRENNGVWSPLRDGPESNAIAGAEEFKPFFTQQADNRRYLYLAVRPDAFQGFREIRVLLEAKGWWVEWYPLELEKPLTVGIGLGSK